MTSVFLRPDADSSDGSWLNEASSGTNLFASVDDTTSTGADADYIRSSSAQGDKVRLRLSDPGVSVTSPMVVRYRVKAEALPAALVGRLYQGASTLVAYWEELPTTSFATYTYTLTTAEFNSITDFNDLYVEFEYDSAAPHLSGNIDLWFEAGTYYDSSLDPNSDPATLMLHMNGADASTTFTDEKGHTVTAGGNAQIDTAQSKFGGASALFDGTGDYLTIPRSSDFIFGTGDFTIDLWTRFNANGIIQDIVGNGTDGGSGGNYSLYRDTDDKIKLYNNGVRITGTATISTSTWYHLALTRSGTSTKLFVDGTQDGSTFTDNTNYGIGATYGIVLGSNIDLATQSFNGWMDEVRVVKGTAMWTSNFTPPTVAYAVQTGPLNLLSCSRASTGYAETVAGTLTNFAANELRITDKGLLVEDARTNIVPYNNNNDTNWIDDGVTHTLSAATFVDGTTTATQVTVAAGGYHFRYQNYVSTIATTYTASAFLKAGTTSLASVAIQMVDFSYETINVEVNLSTGAITSNPVDTTHMTSSSGRTEQYADGWWRVSLIFTATAVCSATRTGVTVSSNTNGEYVYFGGTQLEVGSFASSYIPTTTTSVTRAADSVTCIGNLEVILETLPQSAVVDALASSYVAGKSWRLIGTNNGAVADALLLDYQNVDAGAYEYGGNNFLHGILGNSKIFTTGAKAGASQQAGARSVVGGGGTVVTDAFPVTLINPLLGRDGSAGTDEIYFGYFRRLTAWNTRLADATLQGLTNP